MADSADRSGGEFGLLGRYRLMHGLELEGELSRTRTTGTLAEEEWKMAGGLLFDFRPRRFLSPYVVGAVGLTLTADHSARGTAAGFLEGGAGLHLRLGSHVVVGAELRGGALGLDDSKSKSEYQETYLRARVAGFLYF